MRTARVLAVANQKGGVGKTTTSINLAASISATDRRVLLVDLDPQGNASSGVGVGRAQIGDGPTVYDVLAGRATLAEIARETELPHLWVAPSTTDLAGAEIELVTEERASSACARCSSRARGDFDYVVIDTPPSLGPAHAERAGRRGRACWSRCSASTTRSRACPTSWPRSSSCARAQSAARRSRASCSAWIDPRQNLTQQVAGEVTTHFADKVYETIIPRNVRLGEAPSFGKPILLYDVASRGARATWPWPASSSSAPSRAWPTRKASR